MFTIEVPVLQIITATIAAMMIGAVWYSFLFGKVWMKLVNMSEKDLKTDNKTIIRLYSTSVLHNLLQAFVLYNLINLTGATTILDSLEVGFWVWLAFVLMHEIVTDSFAGRDLKLALLDAGKDVPVILTMLVIFVYWT